MRYTVKININKEEYYQFWSTIINAPVTYILNEIDFTKFYKNQYGIKAYKEWKLGYRKYEDFSYALKQYNKYHEHINKIDFINRYSNTYTKDLLVMVKDIIKPCKYIYKGKEYKVLITTYHKELKKNFIICKTDTCITYLDFNIFLNPNAIIYLG